jgi:hypothetical protein
MKRLLIIFILLILPTYCFAFGVLKQSTATNIIIGPFLDDADYKTPETALDVTGFNFDIYKGVSKSDITITASGGSNDCVHVANGYYNCELTTGDTDTLGRFRVTVNVTGALPIWEDYRVEAQDTAGYSTVTIKDGTGTGEIDTNAGAVVSATTCGTCTALGANSVSASALATDAVTEIWAATYTAELTGIPTTNVISYGQIQQFLFEMARNKFTQTNTTGTLYKCAESGGVCTDTGTVGTTTVSDDGTTFTRGRLQ